MPSAAVAHLNSQQSFFEPYSRPSTENDYEYEIVARLNKLTELLHNKLFAEHAKFTRERYSCFNTLQKILPWPLTTIDDYFPMHSLPGIRLSTHIDEQLEILRNRESLQEQPQLQEEPPPKSEDSAPITPQTNRQPSAIRRRLGKRIKLFRPKATTTSPTIATTTTVTVTEPTPAPPPIPMKDRVDSDTLIILQFLRDVTSRGTDTQHAQLIDTLVDHTNDEELPILSIKFADDSISSYEDTIKIIKKYFANPADYNRHVCCHRNNENQIREIRVRDEKELLQNLEQEIYDNINDKTIITNIDHHNCERLRYYTYQLSIAATALREEYTNEHTLRANISTQQQILTESTQLITIAAA